MSTRPVETAPRKVFISAAAGDDTRPLREVLAELGHDATAVTPQPGMPYGPAVVEAIRAADLVVVILPGKDSGQAVLVDAGAALALDKRMLMLSPTPDRNIPADLLHISVAQAELHNRAALRTAINRALALPANLPRHIPDTTRALRDEVDQIDSVAHDAIVTRDHERFARTVHMALSSAGLQLGSQAMVGYAQTPNRSDFVGWADSLGDLLGNPFVIEVRLRYPSGDDLVALKAVPRTTGVRTVLLLVGERTGYLSRSVDAGGGGSVLIVNFRALLENLRSATLAEALSSAFVAAQHH